VKKTKDRFLLLSFQKARLLTVVFIHRIAID
jgi:hypothetical protein